MELSTPNNGEVLQVDSDGNATPRVVLFSKLIKGASKNTFIFDEFSKYSNYENIYHCRVRTYKTKNRIKAYSEWSEEKKVVIKR